MQGPFALFYPRSPRRLHLCPPCPQVRIKYHFFYAWQPPCMTEPVEQGAHQADWEAVTLLLSEDMTRVAAVTFEQHGGRYTRVAGRDGFQVGTAAARAGVPVPSALALSGSQGLPIFPSRS